jgi:hypothetical protein
VLDNNKPNSILSTVQSSGGKISTITKPLYASATAIVASEGNFVKGDFGVVLSDAAVKNLQAAGEIIKKLPECSGIKKRSNVVTLTSCALRIENTVSGPALDATILIIGEDVAKVIPAGTLMAAPAWAVNALNGIAAAQATALIFMGAFVFNEESPAEIINRPIGHSTAGCQATEAPQCTVSCTNYPFAESYVVKSSSSCSSSCHTITACGAKATSITQTFGPTNTMKTVEDVDIGDTFTNTGQEPIAFSDIGSMAKIFSSLGLTETMPTTTMQTTTKPLPLLSTTSAACTSYLQAPKDECRLILNTSKSGVACPPPTTSGQTCTVSCPIQLFSHPC